MSTDQVASQEPYRANPLTQVLIVTGILIAVANMVLAWVLIFSRPTELPAEKLHPQLPVVQEKDVLPDPLDRVYDRALERMRDMVLPYARVYEKEQLTDSNILTLTVAFSFALMSIGFSLFVMGIEGALNLRGQIQNMGSLVLRTSSPGIICIILSTLTLVLLLLLTQVTFGDTQEAAKADIIRAESESKADAIRIESEAKADAMRVESDAKAETIRAESDAKARLIEAEIRVKEER